jgi:hypothetical protein
MESSKRIILVSELDKHNHAEVVFTKNLIQNKEDIEDCEMVVPRGGIEPPTQGFSVLCSTD